MKLTKEMLKNQEIYELVKGLFKDKYLPKTFEEFILGFDNKYVEENGQSNDVVYFLHEQKDENGAIHGLPLVFYKYGFAIYSDNLSVREKIQNLGPNTINFFNFDFQKVIGEKFGDLDYFVYLKKKNESLLNKFKEEVKNVKPKIGIFDFAKKKEFKNKVQKDRQELVDRYTKHMEYINEKISKFIK